MPNWVDMDLTVTGPQDELDQFYAFAVHTNDSGKPYLDFNDFVPMPEIISRVQEDGRGFKLRIAALDSQDWHDDLKPENYRLLTDQELHNLRQQYGEVWWYDWSCKYWGTKWNACATIFDPAECKPGRFVIHFSTAWSPPDPVFQEMVKQFPKLSFQLDGYEGGMCYQVHYYGESGEVMTTDVSRYEGNRGG